MFSQDINDKMYEAH